ncbi:MAG: disulfide bond formation protein B [Bradyrhizobium sp.]|nr:MAG: disulfide bond formation protein B [Bradyrhizobium sp.]
MLQTLAAFAFPPTQLGRALRILLATLAILATVWILELAGYRPCELCLAERYAFYVGAPLAALTAYAAARGSALARLGFLALALVFLANAGYALYHAGVEYHFWQGPTACTGALSGPLKVEDLIKQAQAAQPVRCDEPAMVVLGLSLAGWDLIASAAIALYAAFALRLKR